MFYIFHGEDSYSQQESLASLKEKLGDALTVGLNTTEFVGKQLDWPAFQYACQVMPFLSDKRVVIVHDFFKSSPDKKLLKDMLDYLPQLPETARVIFLESATIRSNHRILKLADKSEIGYAKLFDPLQGGALKRWIEKRVKEGDCSISQRAVSFLMEAVGTDLNALTNELEKLILYKGGSGSIEYEDILLLSPYAAEVNIFALVDAVGERKGKAAVSLLQQKLMEGGDPFQIFGMIVRQFRLLIQVKELADQKQAPATIAKNLKMHSFVAGKVFQQAKQFEMGELERIYQFLLETDIGVKTGEMDMVTGLNLLVAGVTV